LAQTNQTLVHVNAERLSFKNEVDKLSKELAQLKSQLQSAQTQLQSTQTQLQSTQAQQSLQAQGSKIDNSEIQKKYQVSFLVTSLLFSFHSCSFLKPFAIVLPVSGSPCS